MFRPHPILEGGTYMTTIKQSENNWSNDKLSEI